MLYTSMKFPDHVHREYPKMIHFADGRPSVVVESAEEECALEEGDEKAELMAKLDAKGAKYDKRWGVDRLKSALE